MMMKKEFMRRSLYIYQSPKHGQSVCGDSYFTIETNGYLLMAIADGLGSGHKAKEASEMAIRCFKENHHLDVEELIYRCNRNLQGTRGVVAGVLKLNFHTSLISFAGIGNIQLLLFPPYQRRIPRPISKPGYLNGRPIRVRKDQFTYVKGTPFIMFSDGLEVNQTFANRIKQKQKPDVILEQMKDQLEQMKDDVTLIIAQT